ncbi:MAG: adenylate/guanylate cyclase domain-containing protein [Gaiellaceae bacterium]
MIFWLVALAVPIAGLVLLLVQPDLDRLWEHHPVHFWLVLSVAAVNVVLGLLAGEAARRLADARLFLVAMAFVGSAAFLGLHALATPGVLLDDPNTGFVIATPVGLLIAGGFAGASALDLEQRSESIIRRRRLIRNLLLAAVAIWAVVSLAEVPPLDEPLPPEEARGPLIALGTAGVALYGFAALRYLDLSRRSRARMLVAVAAAFALLAEAMVAIAAARNWHVSWWEWHVLMALAFGLVALAAWKEYKVGASPFAGLYLRDTIARLDRRYGRAIEDALETGETPRGDLTVEEAKLVERAAGEIRKLEDLFRPYLSPQVTARLRADPAAAELGGEARDISVLFADLEGFTSFSEGSDPAAVVEMLNAYWAEAVPAVAAEGGLVERFAGDAVMVVFNAAEDQSDHAARAARAALGLQRATAVISEGRPDWPRFRVGVNSGPAVVGNVGSVEQRSFTAIGDTTNLAARLQTVARPGQVVIGARTRDELGDTAVVAQLDPLAVKGKAGPVVAFLLLEAR